MTDPVDSVEAPTYPDALFSQGQIDMFLARSEPIEKGCPRRWALHYCSGIAKKTNANLDFGSLTHAVLEDFGTGQHANWPTHWTGAEADKEARDRGKAACLAQAMYHHRPDGVYVAEPTYYYDDHSDEAEGGLSYHVKPDAWADRKIFLDWKTTSQLPTSQWVLNADTLRSNVQFNLYALGLMKRWRTQSITGRWIYGNTGFKPGQAPRTWIVDASITLRQAEAFYARVIRPTALLMQGLKLGILSGEIDSSLLIPHHPESCDHRGKFCDALAFCNFAPTPLTLSDLHLPVIQ